MFCCFPPLRRPSITAQNDEKKPLIKSNTTTINYRTIFAIPYAHVIRDDEIQIESSNVMDTNGNDAYLLFNATISDETYETACVSFDDNDVATPVVFTTTTANPHFLFERLFQVDHVTAINPSSAIRMHQINSTKTNFSNTISMARPFDEFAISSTIPNNPHDTVTKTDKN
ncbi:unnamed protein product [Adineta steineri]|uniref:Uncharacterized protein n=1 Tax=Adineta steineri TaxID=433720 RepID=A0A818P9G5_9BILA|nr:unnamed protein product [Adineta steineri]CAF0949013.1 unnamed protein product [Adineta steineri]CAF1004668.1 unnamed protein product [Adineta steineri]CAF3533374.1 unnamed protein product [Adineta steineri]CAF3618974.1 unnamed protein product [Adineta steineri]